MGLALYNSSNALESLSQGPSQVTTSRPRPRAHHRGAFLRADGSLSLHRDHADPRLHLLDLVQLVNHQNRAHRRRRPCRRRPQHNRDVSQWRADDEGRAPAGLGGVRVPGGGDTAPQLRRTPSLERQGAFRVPGTGTARCREERDVADLCRLGLLYDDERLRGAGSDLGSIVHDEPEFAMRPAKRARGTGARRRSFEDDLQLALDISLAELGRDESFARYLVSPDLHEPPSDDESTTPERAYPATGLISPPESLCGETPDLTPESGCDSESSFTSLSSFIEYDQCMTNYLSDWGDELDHGVSDDAWMVLGDGL